MQIHLDYYELGITPVVIVRDAASGSAQQAWRADIAQNRMVRDDTIIMDIDDGGTSDFRALDKAQFDTLCADLKVIVPPIGFFNTPAANAVEHMSHNYRRAVGQDFIANDDTPAPSYHPHLRLVA